MTAKSKNRLYVASPLETGASIVLAAEQAHYVGRVLRLRVGDELTLFNGQGGEYSAVATEMSRQGVTVRIGKQNARDAESPLAIDLIQGIARGDRMDIVVQKATELGVRRISPVIAEFTVMRLDSGKAEKRAAHWARIAASACEQCGRNVPPIIDIPQAFRDRLANAESNGTTRLVLRPGAERTLNSSTASVNRLELLIGPEGGLSDAEYEQAAAAGFVACSLGPRVLRTETAAVAAIAVLQSKWGDLR